MFLRISNESYDKFYNITKFFIVSFKEFAHLTIAVRVVW